ncbi:MAG: DUF1905 domain-containing protein [Deinococcales bacterium]
MKLEFSGQIWYWRGPAPHYFVTVPEDCCQTIKSVSSLVTYGWGMIPVWASIGKTLFRTSLFPKNGSYIVPIKADVRRLEGLSEDDVVLIALELGV